MNRHGNAPAEQAQNLSKDCKIETHEKDFEDILAATSNYYSKVLEKLADGEPSGRKRMPEQDDEPSPTLTGNLAPDKIAPPASSRENQ